MRAGLGHGSHQRLGGEVAVQQHDHALAQTAEQARCICRLAVSGRAEHRVDDRASAAGHQHQQPQGRISQTAVVAAVLGELGQVRRAVGHRHGRAVDAQTSSPRHHTPAVPMPAAGPRSRSNSQRSGSVPTRRRACASAPPVGSVTVSPSRPAVSRCHTCRQPSPGNRHPASSRYTTTPGRQIPNPCLHPARLRQRFVDHLERDKPGQLAQMAGRESSRSNYNLTRNDRLGTQRSSRRTVILGDTVLAGAPSPCG